jgi:predicted aminopeptidase
VARRLLVWVVVGVPALVLLALVVSSDTRFIARAAFEEARILLRRRSIQALVANASTPAPLRQRLQLVLAARSYGADSMHLVVSRNYTTYAEVKRDTLLLVPTLPARSPARTI